MNNERLLALQEADKRGLLKGPQKEAYDEAVKRGLIGASEIKAEAVSEPESGMSAALGAGVDKLQEIGYRAAEGLTDVIGEKPEPTKRELNVLKPGPFDSWLADKLRPGAEVDQWAEKGIERNVEEQKAYEPTVKSYKDIGGLKDFGNYAGELVAGSLPYMAAAANPIGAATLAGGLSQEAYEKQPEDEKNAARAVASGSGQMLLERLGIKVSMGQLGKDILKDGVVETAKRMGRGELVEAVRDPTFAKRILKGAGAEGLTETGQEALAQWGAGKSIDEFEGLDEAFVGGLTVGGVMRTGSETAQKVMGYQQKTAEAVKQGAEQLVEAGSSPEEAIETVKKQQYDAAIKQGFTEVEASAIVARTMKEKFGIDDPVFAAAAEPEIAPETDAEAEAEPAQTIPEDVETPAFKSDGIDYDAPTAARQAGFDQTAKAAGQYGDMLTSPAQQSLRDLEAGNNAPTVDERVKAAAFDKSPTPEDRFSPIKYQHEGELLGPDAQNAQGIGNAPIDGQVVPEQGKLPTTEQTKNREMREQAQADLESQPKGIDQKDIIFGEDGRPQQRAAEQVKQAGKDSQNLLPQKDIIFAGNESGVNVARNGQPFKTKRDALLSKEARAARRAGQKTKAVTFDNGFGWTIKGDDGTKQDSEQAAAEQSPEADTVAQNEQDAQTQLDQQEGEALSLNVDASQIKDEEDKSIAGEMLDDEWQSFTKESGTKNIPRSEMPQIKAENRGAMVNFMKARDIGNEKDEVQASSLKPTQQEFSPAKVKKAMEFEGGNRSILVSNDGYVLDGHHQWLAAREKDETVKVTRLNAPIEQLVPLAKEMPSTETQGNTKLIEQEPATTDQQAELPPILKTTKRKWLQSQAKEQGLKKGSPGFDVAMAKIEEGYEPAIDKALAESPFETYQEFNSDTPESINRQAYSELRKEFGFDDAFQAEKPAQQIRDSISAPKDEKSAPSTAPITETAESEAAEQDSTPDMLGDSEPPLFDQAPTTQSNNPEIPDSSNAQSVSVSSFGVNINAPVVDSDTERQYNMATHRGRGRDFNEELKNSAESILAELNDKGLLDTPERKNKAKELVESYLEDTKSYIYRESNRAANNPSWAITGRGNLDLDKYNSKAQSQARAATKEVDRLESKRKNIAVRVKAVMNDEQRAAAQQKAESSEKQKAIIDFANELGAMQTPGLNKSAFMPRAKKAWDRIVSSHGDDLPTAMQKIESALAKNNATLKGVLGSRSKLWKEIDAKLNDEQQSNSSQAPVKQESIGELTDKLEIESTDTNVRVYGDPEKIRSALKASGINYEGAEVEGGLSFGKKLEDQIRTAIEGDTVKFFSKGSSNKAKGVSKVEADKVAGDFIRSLNGANGIKVRILETTAEAEKMWRMSLDGATVKGAYSEMSNTVYIIAENMDSIDDLKQTLAHETIAHGGLDTVIGKEAKQEFIDRIKKTKGRKAFEKYWKDANNDYWDASEDVKAEEIFARFVESEPSKGEVKYWWNALKRFIRKQLDKLGVVYREDDEVTAMRDMLESIVKGFKAQREPVATSKTEMAYSQSDKKFSRTANNDTNPAPNKIAESVKKAFNRDRFEKSSVPEWEALNAQLRETDKTAGDKIKRQLSRWFMPGGNLPETVQQAKRGRDRDVAVHEFDVSMLVGKLNSAMKAAKINPDRLADDQWTKYHQFLIGENDGKALNQSERDTLILMREHIDGLTKDYVTSVNNKLQQRLEEDGAIDPKESARLEKMLGNMGKYLNRSYKAFDDPKWFEKIPTKVADDARAYLMKQYEKDGATAKEAQQKAQVTMNEMVKTGTAYDSLGAFIAESKLGSKDLSTLIPRKDISPEIRALLGEYADPRINYAKSVSKMSAMIANDKLLNTIRDMGMNNFIFEKDSRPPNATVQLAGEASEVYAPLNGMWTTPEIKEAFEDAMGGERGEGWLDKAIQINGFIKFGKTVLSPTTAMRNVMSAYFFTVANGHFNQKYMKQAVAAFNAQVKEKVTDGESDYIKRLIKLGVLYDSANAGDIVKVMTDGKINQMLDGKSNTGFDTLNKVADKTTENLRWLTAKATGFYRFGDDFWKIIGFENEKAALVRTGMKEGEAEALAAERIQNTYPTYSRVGKAGAWLSRFPLAGTFVSFPAEVIRTTGNMMKLAASEIKSDNPKIREMGAKRIVGMSLASGGMFALSALSAAMFGVTDDEEEALRDLAPPWQKNSTFIYAGRDSDNNLRYFDMSFLDPYAYWKRPIEAMMRDQPVNEAIASSLSDMVSPFLGTDITTSKILEVISNKKSSGGQVYKENDTAIRKSADIASHLALGLAPGFVNNAWRIGMAAGDVKRSTGKPYSLSDEMLALVGFRSSTFDPKVGLYYRTFDFNGAIAEARKELSGVLRDPNKVSDNEISAAKARAKTKQEQAFKQMSRLIKAAQTGGASRRQVVQILLLAGISKRNVGFLLREQVPPVNLSDRSFESAVKRAQLIMDNDSAREVRSRFNRIIKND